MGTEGDEAEQVTLFDQVKKRWLNRKLFVIVVLASIAVVWLGQVTGTLSDLWSRIRPKPHEVPGLAHVRTTIARSQSEPDLPILEVTLRNRGQEVVVISGARVTTLKRWRIGPTWIAPLVTPVSEVYDVGVPAAQGESTITQVTQELRPQTADRFQLKLGPLQHETAWDPPFGLFVFLLRIELRYNEGETRELPLVFTHIPPPVSVLASTDVGPNLEACRAILRTAKAARTAVPSDGVADQSTLNEIDREIDALEELLRNAG